MKKFKIFIASFAVTFAVMAVALSAVCGQILIKTQQAEVKKENVPVNIPSARDRVRLFLRLGNEDSRVYGIIKFNAIEGKIGIGIISPEFKIKDGYTRDEKSRTFSSNSKRSHILRTSSRSRRLILSSIVSFAVWLKCTRTI